jgi:HAMP domain-containing protein
MPMRRRDRRGADDTAAADLTVVAADEDRAAGGDRASARRTFPGGNGSLGDDRDPAAAGFGASGVDGQVDSALRARSGRRPRGVGVAERLPSFLGSIKVRLAVLYSVLVFGLAALMVGSLYAALSRALDEQPMTREVHIEAEGGDLWVIRRSADGVYLQRLPEGSEITGEKVDPVAVIVGQANRAALEYFKRYAFYALGTLFFLSLGIGYLIADRALRPIGRITRVAREISATDLSRRIELSGPNDELRRLADTFDEMLSRLDAAWESQRAFIHEASHELRN